MLLAFATVTSRWVRLLRARQSVATCALPARATIVIVTADSDTCFHQQLQTEIKIHKALSHKHVVRFEEVFEDKENVYIIMELCPNQTMLELVKRKKRLTEQETRRFMLQMVCLFLYLFVNIYIYIYIYIYAHAYSLVC